MKKNNFKKLVSIAAMLTLSATAALSAISFTACSNDDKSGATEPEKLITADQNHSAHFVSTAQGTVKTESSGKIYYATPEGVLSNDGSSWDKPASLFHILGEESKLEPGDTVYVKPGTYKFDSCITTRVSGAYNKYIRIVNAAYEKTESGYQGSDKLVTLDFSNQFFASTSRGVQLYGNYIYWYGIDICGAGDNGLYIGGSYNTVEFSEFYNNRDTGLQLGRAESGYTLIDQWPNYNLVKNCTSHNNYDNETYGENADGFAAKLTVGYGNVFDGCIAYRNSDDGWDLYAKSDSGNIGCVIIYNCVAFENGYLEYPQAKNNARFPTFKPDTYAEKFEGSDDVRYFRTRDGDGNGFKLGGSVMEGDVVMYNCLAYGNRMHGVTDNSNPGYLKIQGVTSYDNGAVVDENPESATYGQIISTVPYTQDEYGNINVSRQVYSYNSVINTLSVKSSDVKHLGADEYRGSVTNSVLLGSGVQNVITGSYDADTINKKSSTSTKALLDPSEVFVKLPYTISESVYTYNLSGYSNLYANAEETALNEARVHVTYRNEDGSINMHDILAKKDGVDDSLLLAGKNLGSTLNKANWEGYTHFFASDSVNGNATSEDKAKIERIYETLTINTDENGVYQDFEIPLMMKDCTISWASSNEEVVKPKTVIGADGKEELYVENSISGSKYGTMLVYRPATEQVKVTLTATIKCGTETKTKEFEINVVPGIPSIGKIMVVTQDGTVLTNGSSYVVDQYSIFTEPEISVENGLDYNGKLLTSSQYTYTTKYMYSAVKGGAAIEIADFTPSNAGVYTITHTVTLASDTSKTAQMTYTVYVSSVNAEVDFLTKSVSVNLNGFIIDASLNNATGYLYAVGTDSATAPTKDTIKTYEGVQCFNFRNDSISFQFSNANSGAYTIYYAIANLNGKITSDICQEKISVVAIDTTDKFMKIAKGDKIGGENPKATIYQLTKDLDFTGVTWTLPSKAVDFTGLFNGMGHKISNVTINGSDDVVGIFGSVKGATIENVKFDNISIHGGKRQVGIIGTAYGGYFHNIAITNVKISADGERVGGLIGHLFEYATPTYISQVSIVNPMTVNAANDGEGYDYYIKSTASQRVGGIIGLIQTTSNPTIDVRIYISDCYVISYIFGTQQVGGVVGAFDNAKTNIDYQLDITRCYFGGVASSNYSTPRVGGILGYQSNNVGSFTIKDTLSVGELHYGSDHLKLTQSLKTASLIVGGFASAAVNTVSNCIALIEEYNSDYDVNVNTVRNLQDFGAKNLVALLGEGWEAKWSLVNDAENEGCLKAPYLTLNFLT